MTDVKVNYPGLLIEPLAGGRVRYRVRRIGKKAVRTAIPVGPDHPDFLRHYTAARHGDTGPQAARSRAAASAS